MFLQWRYRAPIKDDEAAKEPLSSSDSTTVLPSVPITASTLLVLAAEKPFMVAAKLQRISGFVDARGG
jgi:hypothetical protein